ncbi:MAG: hypothetical protein A2163_07895 [Actinobacteria bacterium RBG_13_35_12]|nr:MAG: hypothetical protein A2163_07895 [Actinobacteria bacterium RBG_13_35_12]
MIDLSILIPARNEIFLARTIKDILTNMEGNTEIIAVLDGAWADPPVKDDPRVTIIHHSESIGQRAASNEAARLSKAKYLMKVDAHCAFDKGFDVKMMADMQDNWTMLPIMRNLHAFDWVCPDGHRRYQSPSGVCTECGKETKMDIVWIAKTNPQSTAYRFDTDMHFQYQNDRKNTAEYKYGVILGYRLSFNPESISPRIIDFLTNLASSHGFTCRGNNSWIRENMTFNTMSFSPVNNSGGEGTSEVLFVRNQSEVGRITTPAIITKMVNDWNTFTSSFRKATDNPSIENSVCECFFPETMESSISTFVNSSDPIPATRSFINSDLIKDLNNIIGGQFVYSEKTSSFHNGSVTLIPIVDKELNESMSIQGSCFMVTRDKWFELDICSEEFNSWGQQGVEVACKTWLSGGKVIVNHKTWYAHMFRTQGGDFSFPYDNPQSKVLENRAKSKELFAGNKWFKAIHDFQWLINKFNPPDWQTKGILFYTDNQLGLRIAHKVQKQLLKANLPIVSVSLKPMPHFGKNIHLPLERGYITLTKQIIAGLEALDTDIVFMCEHDVLYPTYHFDFTPTRKDVYYYNTNSWWLRAEDGHCLYFTHRSQSGLCGFRETLLKHYKERLRRMEELIASEKDGMIVATSGNLIPLKEGIHRLGFEPGTHNRPEKIDDLGCEDYQSEIPFIDIRHDNNLTQNRWRIDQFRSKPKEWVEANEIPFWGKGNDLICQI